MAVSCRPGTRSWETAGRPDAVWCPRCRSSASRRLRSSARARAPRPEARSVPPLDAGREVCPRRRWAVPDATGGPNRRARRRRAAARSVRTCPDTAVRRRRATVRNAGACPGRGTASGCSDGRTVQVPPDHSGSRFGPVRPRRSGGWAVRARRDRPGRPAARRGRGVQVLPGHPRRSRLAPGRREGTAARRVAGTTRSAPLRLDGPDKPVLRRTEAGTRMTARSGAPRRPGGTAGRGGARSRGPAAAPATRPRRGGPVPGDLVSLPGGRVGGHAVEQGLSLVGVHPGAGVPGHQTEDHGGEGPGMRHGAGLAVKDGLHGRGGRGTLEGRAALQGRVQRRPEGPQVRQGPGPPDRGAARGARKAGVPTIPPVLVIAVSCLIAAMPKSVSTTRPSSASSTFPGLTSRCSTPAACAARSAPSTCSPTGPPGRAPGGRPRGRPRPATGPDQLHHDPGPALLLDHVVHDDHGWMVEPPGGPGLPDRPPVQVGPRGLVDPAVADLLDRHDPVESSSWARQTMPIPPSPMGSSRR